MQPPRKGAHSLVVNIHFSKMAYTVPLLYFILYFQTFEALQLILTI